MNPNKIFDLFSCPLRGIHLVEASAGTGKTFTLTQIFLRMILEGTPLTQILTVTFTKAAAAELRNRIRSVLMQSLRQLSGGSEEKSIQEILSHYPKDQSREKIIHSVQSLDRLSIDTIHGFCNKIMQEYSFSGGILPESEVTEDEDELLREAVLDFWRSYLQNAPPFFLSFLQELKTGPNEWCEFLKTIQKKHPYTRREKKDIKINPLNKKNYKQENYQDRKKHLHTIFSTSFKDILSTTEKWEKEFYKLQRVWSQFRVSLNDYISNLEIPVKSRKKKNLSKDFFSLIQALDFHFEKHKPELIPFAVIQNVLELQKIIHLDLFGSFQEYTRLKLSNSEIWYQYWKLLGILQEKSSSLLLELLEYFPEECLLQLTYQKNLKRILSYTDLLLLAHQCIHEPITGKGVLRGLQKNYTVALIDEFQDTDQLQWEIFQTIFTSPNHSLFLIGDPKQSIYSFRGADINVYLQARKKTRNQWNLGQNYRSHKNLLEGVHFFFQNVCDPFGNQEIPYVLTKATRSSSHLLWNGKESRKKENEIPLQFIFSDSEGIDKKQNISELEEAIEDSVCLEIARLLHLSKKGILQYNSSFKSSSSLLSPFQPKQIAILVRRTEEGRRMRDRLQTEGIPSVLCAEENIFQTQEAEDLEIILSSLAEGNIQLAKGALSTSIWGKDHSQIREIFDSAKGRQEIMERFQYYAKVWQNNGFMSSFRIWLEKESIAENLLQYVGGKRSLMNLTHLAELLHLSGENGKRGLLHYLRKNIQNSAHLDDSSFHLRLESGESSVQIMTIHRSKGLEFPIVFCPSLWRDYKSSLKHLSISNSSSSEEKSLPIFLQKMIKFSDALTGLKESLEKKGFSPLGLKKLQEESERESFSENIRLIYTALTRAEERLYIYWPDRDTSISQTAYYLFSGGDIKDSHNQSSQQKESLYHILKQKEDSFRESIHIKQAPVFKEELLEQYSLSQTEKKLTLKEAQWNRNIESSRHIHSFSSTAQQLHKGLHFNEEHTFEKNDSPLAQQDISHPYSIFHFPSGIHTGNFFHEFLEKANYKELAKNQEKTKSSLQKLLLQYNLDIKWKDTLSKLIDSLLCKKIFASIPSETFSQSSDEKDFTLGILSPNQYITEFDFYYYLHPQNKKDIKNGSYSSLPEMDIEIEFLRQRNSQTRGEKFMRGYIDLIFTFQDKIYVIDWKSNLLGTEIEDYSPSKLYKNIKTYHYDLQYYIYTDAVDRFFSLRFSQYTYTQNFGGIFYIYLRGINRLTQDGIYFYRIPEKDLASFRSIMNESI